MENVAPVYKNVPTFYGYPHKIIFFYLKRFNRQKFGALNLPKNKLEN